LSLCQAEYGKVQSTSLFVPSKLSQSYRHIKISHLPDKDRLCVLSILQWAAFALCLLMILEITKALLIINDNGKDLSVDELADAIDEDYVNSEILGLCGSLLETPKAASKQDLGSMTIDLAHFLFQTLSPLSAMFKRHSSSLLMMK